MCIYKITNKINNKVYIGQTTKTVEERWKRHSIEKQINRRKEIIVEDLDAHKSICFSSFANAERYFDLPLKTLSGKAYLKGNDFVIRSKYHVIILN